MGKSNRKRGKSHRSTASRKKTDPEKKRRRPRTQSNDANDLLGEFSSKEGEFYVDEVKNRFKKKKSGILIKNQSDQSKRKVLTPAKRKIRNILSFSAVLLIVVIACVVLSLTVLFKIQVYEVNGTEKYSYNEIVNTSGLSEGENVFLAPRTLAGNRIKDKFPYVEKVNVDIKIPDTIVFNVTEATEAYLVKITDNEYLVVSSEGRILDTVSSPGNKKIPIFIGPEVKTKEVGKYIKYEDGAVLDTINRISDIFTNNGYTKISEINASQISNLTFTYDGRIFVKLGMPEDLDYKIRTAMTIITEKLDLNEAIPIAGLLDVSKCNETKKSYFKEEALVDQNAAQEGESDAAVEPTEESVNENENLSWDDLFATEAPSGETEESTEEPTMKKLPQNQWYVN